MNTGVRLRQYTVHIVQFIEMRNNLLSTVVCCSSISGSNLLNKLACFDIYVGLLYFKVNHCH